MKRTYYTQTAHNPDRREAVQMARFISRRDSFCKVICGSIAAALVFVLWVAVFAAA